MPSYILPHSIPQEDRRLTLMSRLLDPNTCFRIEQTGVRRGWSCLEVGAGNGSVSYWLASKVGPGGRVVSADMDTNFLERLNLPNLEVRKLDIVSEAIETSSYDLVFARAILHHLPSRFDVIGKLAGAVKTGGYIVLEEPDFHPAGCAENATWRDFWEGITSWAAEKGVDYYIGRKVAPRLQELGIEDIKSHGETLLFNGGSDGAEYYKLFIEEVGADLVDTDYVTQNLMDDVLALLQDPSFWSMNISFIVTSGRKPEK
ncbi:MAG: methyltransferase domain-containing protein [Deltaproteobacteria bacterium]